MDDVREPFLDLVPKGGWLRQYVDFTLLSEAPAVFHYMVGVSLIGSCVSRRAWFSKGYYRVYPHTKMILVAPTGKCKKTSALLIGLKILKMAVPEINMIADKITPEALAQAVSTNIMNTTTGKLMSEKDGEGLVFAPELAVFLGKQKYNEGLITLLTALFDDPDEWSTQTKGGGKILIKKSALSFMGASTPDWLLSAIPQDAFGGGFMSRLLFVVQEDTPRCFPIPVVTEIPTPLVEYVKYLRGESIGEIGFESKADEEWYILWYTSNKGNIPEDDKMAGYHERKPDHLLRLAIVMALCEGKAKINISHMVLAGRQLKFLEDHMVTTFKWLGVKPAGTLTAKISTQLKAAGGVMTHSALLGKMIFYMNAIEFRNSMETLIQSGDVEMTPGTRIQDNIYKLIQFQPPHSRP